MCSGVKTYKAQTKNRLTVAYTYKRRDRSWEDITHKPCPSEYKEAYVSCCNVLIIIYSNYKEWFCLLAMAG
jgi:hypothetical protein